MALIKCPECGKEIETKDNKNIGWKIATLVLSIVIIVLIALIITAANSYARLSDEYCNQVLTIEELQTEVDSTKDKLYSDMAEDKVNELDEEYGEQETETDFPFSCIQPGQYKVGTDIESGEYILFAYDGFPGYFCVSSDANGSDIIFNDGFDTDSILTVNDGEYLQLDRCEAIVFSDFYDAGYSVKTEKDGIMIKVGNEIQEGEYKLISIDDEEGYYCIYSDSRQQDIVANGFVDSTAYVEVKNGQYIKLERCTLEQ